MLSKFIKKICRKIPHFSRRSEIRKKSIIFLAVTTSLFGDLKESSFDSTQRRMIQDLDVMRATFETIYAPSAWKKQHLDWDLDEAIDLAKGKVLSLDPISVKNYQQILRAFFNSFQDYHVAVEFHSTEKAALPFSIQGSKGRYFIVGIDEKTLSKMVEEGSYRGDEIPKIGNELLFFNGEPTHAAIENLKTDLELGSASQSAQWMTEIILTKRMGKNGHSIPQGAVPIVFKNHRKELVQAEMDWIYSPEEIANRPYSKAIATFGKFQPKSLMMQPTVQDLLRQLYHFKPTYMLNSLAESLLEDKKKRDPNRVIHRESIVFGEKIWEEDPKSTFNIHIFRHRPTKKKVGYIRLRTFHPSDDPDAVNALALSLADSIKFLDPRTDALVIDQVDNPGGFYVYCLAILSMLADHPLKVTRDRFALTQHEVSDAVDGIHLCKEMIEAVPEVTSDNPSSFIFGYPIDSEILQKRMDFCQFILNEWEQGKTLSNPIAPEGLEYITGHPLAKYTKPILVLVNEADFSCGDFFPAILQDNKRALIFGERTAGAGGIVKGHSYPNSFGIAKLTYTVSIAERADGTPIENLGVTPDVHYSITKSDLRYGYKRYIKAVNATLHKMLSP